MKNVIIYLMAFTWIATGFISNSPTAVYPPSSKLSPLHDGLPFQDETTDLRIAVTAAGYDDIGLVLASMGWTVTEITPEQLSDYDFLAQFDVLFINCSQDTYDHPEYSDSAKASVEKFVHEGGTLYASDWAFIYVEKSIPGYIHFFNEPPADSDDPSHAYLLNAGIGDKQDISADVLDPGLVKSLGSSTLQIHFDLENWIPIESVSDEVKVYLAGDFKKMDGETISDKPLTVSFPYEKGRVVYTAFHNELQTTDAEKKLLTYLVLISTTEKLSATLRDALTTLHYTLEEELLDSISTGATSPRYTISNPSVINLAIGLNWKTGKLKLSVFKPDGSLYAEKEGSPPLLIEIPEAEAGDWTYEISGIDVPYTNYPFVVQTGTTEVPIANPPGNNGPDYKVILLVIGCVLCLVTFIAVILICLVVVFMKKRKSK